MAIIKEQTRNVGECVRKNSTSTLLVGTWISAATMEIRIEFLQNLKDGRASVAHDCKPSYLGVKVLHSHVWKLNTESC
jgi:hypothetical protein